MGEEGTALSTQLWSTDGLDEKHTVRRIGASWRDPPLLQLVSLQRKFDILGRAMGDVRSYMTTSINHNRADADRVELFAGFNTVVHVPNLLAELSVDGLALAASVVGNEKYPESLREAAADLLCRAFASAQLHGEIFEKVVIATDVCQGLASAFAIGSEASQPNFQRRAAQWRFEWQQSDCRLMLWRSMRLQQRAEPRWAEDGSITPALKMLTQAAMAVLNMHMHVQLDSQLMSRA